MKSYVMTLLAAAAVGLASLTAGCSGGGGDGDGTRYGYAITTLDPAAFARGEVEIVIVKDGPGTGLDSVTLTSDGSGAAQPRGYITFQDQGFELYYEVTFTRVSSSFIEMKILNPDGLGWDYGQYIGSGDKFSQLMKLEKPGDFKIHLDTVGLSIGKAQGSCLVSSWKWKQKEEKEGEETKMVDDPPKFTEELDPKTWLDMMFEGVVLYAPSKY